MVDTGGIMLAFLDGPRNCLRFFTGGTMRKLLCRLPGLTLLLLGCLSYAQNKSNTPRKALDCEDASGILCAEVYDSIGYGGAYTGHDEPSLLFYSGARGSGYTNTYRLRLPK